MQIEIQRPEVANRVNAQVHRRCLDVDELLEQALDALDEKSPLPAAPHGSLHAFFMNSPLRGANLDLERSKDVPRILDIE